MPCFFVGMLQLPLCRATGNRGVATLSYHGTKTQRIGHLQHVQDAAFRFCEITRLATRYISDADAAVRATECLRRSSFIKDQSIQDMATSKTLQSPWRFSDEITLTICRFAGREASAALRIALGTRPIALAAKDGTLYEPFTYWDWHGVAPDEEYTSEKKSQRIWERERGFKIGSDRSYGYPSSRQRWHQFQASIEADPGSRRRVKRIAVAHWMAVEDMNW